MSGSSTSMLQKDANCSDMPHCDALWCTVEVGKLTQRIALLMRGIRETDVAVLGAILVEPKATPWPSGVWGTSWKFLRY